MNSGVVHGVIVKHILDNYPTTGSVTGVERVQEPKSNTAERVKFCVDEKSTTGLPVQAMGLICEPEYPVFAPTHFGRMATGLTSGVRMMIGGEPAWLGIDDKQVARAAKIAVLRYGRARPAADDTPGVAVGQPVEHRAYVDAQTFIAALPEHVMMPRLYFSEDNEAVLEWRSQQARVLITCEGDHRYGYALKRGRKFVPGAVSVQSADQIPDDLRNYLNEHFSVNDRIA